MDNYQKTFETWNKVAELYRDKFMDLDLYKLQQKSPAFKSFAANGYQWFSVAKLTCLVEFINN